MPISFKSLSTPAVKSERTVIIKSTQSWTAPSDVSTVDILLVGGGGGGAGGIDESTWGVGGGGGGAQVLRASLSVTPSTSYTVTIGAGGAAGTLGSSSAASGSNGADSTFGSLATALGGGFGASTSDLSNVATIKATRGGFSAGSSTQVYAPGGGGAGGMASGMETSSTRIPIGLGNYPGRFGGGPGAGVNSNSSAVTSTGGRGIDGFGGGGGGGINAVNYFLGIGIDNGGDGAKVLNTSIAHATAGAANTGGGGGGGAYHAATGNTGTAGAGGSGICIIKYWSAV